ncbi:DNA-binding MarR family transcriptional regulator [Haloactinopolyspora alba]|uniref:DNA-binding MarR family transcriptional regulator n=1 Tax=Haloactinopolyspora alba TaxID=648780 RepID=A0A2P8D5C5_9ACTN|nr:MarR family transcriptional regulator [Haloactinopolyspora alba]PSK92424.1 DNA-binding MarR family transcriptional regulator [Haloactinopolyspora alba]
MIEDTVAFRVLKAMKATQRTIGPALAELGLHPGQELLLSQLWREDGVTQAELITRLGVEPPTVSKALHRLERAGFVRRERTPGHGLTVHLTDDGRALQEPAEQAWRQADAELLRDLDDDDRAAFSAIIRRLTATELAG